MFGEVLDVDKASANEHCLLTTNTRDFSVVDGDLREPHADIAEFFAGPRSKYFISLTAALGTHFPDQAEDLLAELDFREEPRHLDEIDPVIDKLWDQIWYNRHRGLEHRIATGETEVVEEYRPAEHDRTIVRSVWEQAQAAARGIEERYGLEELGPWSDFEWGMLSGQMSALRWVLGEEWESTLDT